MGNGESIGQKKIEEFLERDYDKVNRKRPDYRFGKCEMWKKKGNEGHPADSEMILVKEKWSMSQHESDKYNNRMMQRAELGKLQNGEEFLCKLKMHTHSHDAQWCSSYFRHYSAYEYYQENLAEELKRRMRLPLEEDVDKYMPEPEIWYMIRVLTGGSRALRAQGLWHGDIQPRHVLVSPDGQVKMIEAPLIDQYYTGANRMSFEGDYSAAVSPEQLDVLRHRRPEMRVDHLEKDEIFAIGVTSLCTGTNLPITAFYDYRNLAVNQEAINDNLGMREEKR